MTTSNWKHLVFVTSVGAGAIWASNASAAIEDLTRLDAVQNNGTYTYFARGNSSENPPDPFTSMFYPGDTSIAGADSLDYFHDEVPHTLFPGGGAPIPMNDGELTDDMTNFSNFVFYWNANVSSPQAAGTFDILFDLADTYRITSVEVTGIDTGGARFVHDVGAQLAFTSPTMPTGDGDLAQFGSGQTFLSDGQQTITFTGDVESRYVNLRLAVQTPSGSTGGGKVQEVRIFGELLAAPLPGDLNGDGFVGLDDLDIILNNWNLDVPPGDSRADVAGAGGSNPDGFVGLDDLDVVLNHWNTGTPPVVAVPEPASALLFALGLGLALRRC